MKRVFMYLMALLAMAGGASAQDIALSLGNVTAATGEENVKLPVLLSNEGAEVKAFTLDLALPEGVEVVGYENAGRLADHGMSYYLANDKWTCAVFSTSGKSLSGTSGAVLNILLSVDENVAIQDYTITASSVKVSVNNGSIQLSNATATLKVTGPAAPVELDENSEVGPEASAGSVTVQVKRTIAGGVWNTICLPFAMIESQIKAAFGEDAQIADFTGESMSGEQIKVTFQTVTDGMEANHPYIIKTSKNIAQFEVKGVVIEPDEDAAEVTTGGRGKKSHFYGVFTPIVVDEDMLFLNNNKFYYSAGKTKMKAYRGYFEFYDAVDDGAEAKAIILQIDDDATAVELVNGTMAPANGAMYNTAGQRVNKDFKGVVIQNGKKMLNK